MAIDTDNKKLALMEWDIVWEPGLPLSPGTFGQDDKQQLLWGYPGVLWSAITLAAIATFISRPRPSFISILRPSYIARPRPSYTAKDRES